MSFARSILAIGVFLLLFSGSKAAGLYWIGAEDSPVIPPKWTTGLDVIYQDGILETGSGRSWMISSEDSARDYLAAHAAGGEKSLFFAFFFLALTAADSGNEEILRNIFANNGGGDPGNAGEEFVDTSNWQTICACASTTWDTNSSVEVIPEPSTVLLAVFGGAALLRRRRSA